MLSDNVLDAALNYIDSNVTNLYICSAEPTTYAEASSTYALGSKSTPGVSSPTNGDVSGRKVTISAITDGSVDSTGTASHWALTGGSELIAAGSLSSSQAVTSGNTFTLTAFDVEIPDPS
jgi:hypothetical protein